MHSVEREGVLKPLSQGTLPSPPKKSYPIHRKSAWRIFVWLVLYFIYLVCHDVYVGH